MRFNFYLKILELYLLKNLFKIFFSHKKIDSLINEFYDACEEGDLELVKKLMNNEHFDLNSQDKKWKCWFWLFNIGQNFNGKSSFRN